MALVSDGFRISGGLFASKGALSIITTKGVSGCARSVYEALFRLGVFDTTQRRWYSIASGTAVAIIWNDIRIFIFIHIYDQLSAVLILRRAIRLQ